MSTARRRSGRHIFVAGRRDPRRLVAWAVLATHLVWCTSFDAPRADDASVSHDGSIVVSPTDGSAGMDRDASEATVTQTRDAGKDAPGEDARAAADVVADVACDASCGIVMVAEGFTQASFVAVDSANLYVADVGAGLVYQCSKATPEKVLLGSGDARGIAVDATQVYWTDLEGGTIQRCAIGGCDNEPTSIASNQLLAEGLTFDGTNLYWVSGATNDVLTCVAPSCSHLTTLASNQTAITEMTSLEGYVYWTSGGSLVGCAATGCGGNPYVIQANADGDVVASNGFLYFGEGTELFSSPVSGGSAHRKAIGTSTSPDGLGTDGLDLYWQDDESPAIYRCPVTGCGATADVFAQVPDNPESNVGANVAVDDEYAYWAERTRVYRKRK